MNSLTLLKSAVLITFASLIISSGPAAADSPVPLSAGQTVYVPIYSHIYSGNKERPVYLAATLSIRNADPGRAIQITAVDYYDSSGRLLKRYLDSSIELGKLASIRYVVKESDKSGGSGANFIVIWQANQPATPPLIEAIMISTQNQQGISFTSRGYVIAENQGNYRKKISEIPPDKLP
jgi:hypothetical protein